MKSWLPCRAPVRTSRRSIRSIGYFSDWFRGSLPDRKCRVLLFLRHSPHKGWGRCCVLLRTWDRYRTSGGCNLPSSHLLYHKRPCKCRVPNPSQESSPDGRELPDADCACRTCSVRQSNQSYRCPCATIWRNPPYHTASQFPTLSFSSRMSRKPLSRRAVTDCARSPCWRCRLSTFHLPGHEAKRSNR